jgi:hypothetical protein
LFIGQSNHHPPPNSIFLNRAAQPSELEVKQPN